MKLTLAQLPKQLDTHLAPLYLLASSEASLLQEATQLIRAQAILNGFTERHWFCPTQIAHWHELSLLQQHRDLFAEKKIIEIHLSTGKPGKSGSQHLQTLALQAQKNTHQLIIITSSHLDNAFLHNTWVLTAAKVGVLLPMWPEINQKSVPLNRLVQALLKKRFAECRLDTLDTIEPTWLIWQLAKELRRLLQTEKNALIPYWTFLLQEVGQLEANIKSFNTKPHAALQHFIYTVVVQFSEKTP